MGHVERKQRDKEANRQKILDAARKIAASEGWAAVTIRKIATEIEYTPPIVYEHFENKEDLLHEIIKSGFRELHHKFTEERQAETDPKALIMKLSLNHWDFAFQNQELYQLMFSLERPMHDQEMLARFFEIKELFMQLTGKNEDDVLEIIFNWMCLKNGTISSFMKMKMPPPPSIVKTYREPREVYIGFIERFLNSIVK
ncbi:MAG: TetR/AcrR family transcriptional regulator [Bacteroidota bacterium]|nr:TetR/AcrR family transcriptional regulator [Bacteroidota bacterium]